MLELQEKLQVDLSGSEPINDGSNHYVVLLATGAADGGKRATLAFSLACTSQSMELNTLVFLVGDGSHWAYEGHADGVHQQGFPELQELIDSFVELRGKIFICSACDTACSIADGDYSKKMERRSDIQPRGLASVLSHTIGGTSVTF